ncbi:MAG: papain fold toxin domain-containing protein, partial [Pyrinomonadaceae bacterium]
AGDFIQAAFLIKSLLASGVSLAVIAMVVRKNPDDIAKMAAKVVGEGCFKTGDCKVAAAALMKELEKNGIKGILVRLKTAKGEAIYKDGLRIALDSTEGHFGVQVGDKVYEMYSTKGVPVSKWAKGYTYRGARTTEVKNPIFEVVPPQ